MIKDHRYVPDPYSNNCICRELKDRHFYKTNINIVTYSSPDLFGYLGSIENLPFYTGEKND